MPVEPQTPSAGPDIVPSERPAASRPRASRRWAVPLLATLLIVAWQSGFNAAPPQARARWAMTASRGLCEDAADFFYFYFHFGTFPVAAREVPDLGPTKADALAFVAAHGDRLTMDLGGPTNTPRFGDYGKLLLFYPDAWLRHDPAHPSLLPFDELLFIAALVAVFWAFWREGHARLGGLLVLLVGSDPFQVLEAYGRGNVFSIPVSVMLLALAVHLPFLTGRRRTGRAAWLAAIGSGVGLASLREVRAEAALAGVSLLATYLFALRAPRARRVLLAGAFLAAAAATGAAWQRYWDGRFEDATRFVARAGGDVYRGPHGTHHAFWHAIACGLGDYGGDRGFDWDDRATFRQAFAAGPAGSPPSLRGRYTGGYYLDDTWDGVHPVAPTDLPAYDARVRERVLGTIAAHPFWYARVLGQRALAVLRDATPASLAAGPYAVALPGAGWLLAPLLALFAWRRRRYAALVLFALPLALPALLVYSGRGMTYYGIAHLVAIACGIDWLARARSGAAGLDAAEPAVAREAA